MSTTHLTPSTAGHREQAATSRNSAAPAPQGSATGGGVLALVLSGVALLTAPVLLLLPFIGFAPALAAAAGIVLAVTGLRRATHGRGVAVTGLVVSALLFVLLLGAATVWNLGVVDPAIRDYTELHEAIDRVRSTVLGA